MLVYRYGLASPHENGDVVLEQIRFAHRYHNTLREIERARRAAVRLLLACEQTEIADLEVRVVRSKEEVDRLLKEIKRSRAATHKRVETAEQKTALRAARAFHRETARRIRELRRKVRESPEIVTQMDILNERAAELRRGARAICGLGEQGPYFGAWGTYLLVEAAMQAATKDTPIYQKDGVTASDLPYLKFRGAGAVGVQLQGGASVSDVTTAVNRQLRIALPSEEAWYAERRCDRERAARHGELSMRIGFSEDGAPIWARWRLDMNRRPLPAGAVIKRAAVHRRAVGPHFEWYLTVTLDGAPAIVAPEGQGDVAIDIGWRLMPPKDLGEVPGSQELRVAFWRSGLGSPSPEGGEDFGELRLTATDIRLLREPEELRSRRDGSFETIKTFLGGWLKASPSVCLPGWLVAATANMPQWRAQSRMATVLAKWQEARFAGDEIAFGRLEAWGIADRALWQTEAVRRGKALRRRREIYRIFAAKLANRFSRVLLEAKKKEAKVFDLRPLVVVPDIEDKGNLTARSNRHMASLSELRGAILNAFARRNREIGYVPAEDTTRTCHVCGLVSDRPTEENVTVPCECGAVWDQDDNATRILQLREQAGDVKVVGGARENEEGGEVEEVKEDRWVKARRMQKEKAERMGRAREAAGSPAE